MLPGSAAARNASIESRSLLGSINELVYFAAVEMSAGVASSEATFRLRQVPVTYLGQKAPEDIFQKMIVDQWTGSTSGPVTPMSSTEIASSLA